MRLSTKVPSLGIFVGGTLNLSSLTHNPHLFCMYFTFLVPIFEVLFCNVISCTFLTPIVPKREFTKGIHSDKLAHNELPQMNL